SASQSSHETALAKRSVARARRHAHGRRFEARERRRALRAARAGERGSFLSRGRNPPSTLPPARRGWANGERAQRACARLRGSGASPPPSRSHPLLGLRPRKAEPAPSLVSASQSSHVTALGKRSVRLS